MPAGRQVRRIWGGLGGFVGNRVRAVDGAAVVDALATPFKPGKPKAFAAGIDDDIPPGPTPDWWPGMSADDHDWPEDDDHPGASRVDDYAWPKDHDKGKPSPHPSPHPSEQHKHGASAPVTTAGGTMTVKASDFKGSFEHLTEQSTPAERSAALRDASQAAHNRANAKAEEAEQLRADARAAVKLPNEAANLNAKAARLEDDVRTNRKLASRFNARADEQSD